MKKLIFILLCFPVVIFADQAQENKSIEIFKRLCENASDASIRENNCKLLEQQKREATIYKDFEKNKSLT